jgi:CHASE2 domain-containing sensor protein
VLIGADILGSGDRIESPVHGQVPGVYLHAMALDNLLTFGGRPPFIDAEWVLPVQVLLILITAILGRLAFEDRQEPGNRLQAARALTLRLIAWVVITLAILALMFGVPFGMPLGPNNWGSIVAIAGAIFFSGGFKDFYVLLFGGTQKELDDDD